MTTTMATRLPTKFKATTAELRKAVGDVWLYPPYPPSVNANYRAVGGRVILSEKYRAWKKLAAQELQAQKAPRILGPVMIDITLRAPDKRRRDCDNPLKAILDCLTNYGVIEDDSNAIVKQLSVQWAEGTGVPCAIYLRSI